MNVIKISPSYISANSYLILSKKPVLIDAGMDAKLVIEKIYENKIKKLHYIILTHMHYDHIAASMEIKKRTGAKIIMHRDDAVLIKKSEFTASNIFGKNNPKIKIDKCLVGNERFNLGDIELIVIHTPGHTPGSICLYEKNEKVIFSGDTVFPDGGFGRTDLPGGDHKKLIESLKILCKLDITKLYPGHMEITNENVNEQIKKSLVLAKSMV
ncbi:MAG: MBL fold metallo-hydrolase [Candidatus Parvarchaeota archaeon]|nr:MBL fold metallo-hydrolase [Candidatus Jingweiarchaeum tengchongense]MCW1298039.1 MBL fold metallo-hydrolase [Candidatus Jingweiarchaeum tengchongense]MCW1300161.1 MBL fold metallo-hydrolase [Candidatus Jingweiarchaeum tengchongense]MCW1304371.1 MBL fold metallo-hydrolase [Candidatus Jingweiarchaeum tengchongense]MCW1305909.1 MBL fold metallo-hydrolase [Candidatus Jingweiarchaeum tengchongense]